MSASCAVLCYARRGFQPIRVTRLTHVLWKCFVSPKREFAHFDLVLLNRNFFNFFFENEIDMGIYEWE